MNPRVRRLQADYASLQELAARSSIITIETAEGNPPERYVIQLHCKGVHSIDRSGRPTYTDSHRLEIQLHDSYPSRKPLLMMLSKMFHPNISTRGTVCIGSEGDHGYAPSMKLADLVLRIIEMVRYENIGFTSPFNLEAKRWAQKNMHLFPLDDGQIVTESALDIVILEESLGDGSGDHVGDHVDDSVDNLLDEISIL